MKKLKSIRKLRKEQTISDKKSLKEDTKLATPSQIHHSSSFSTFLLLAFVFALLGSITGFTLVRTCRKRTYRGLEANEKRKKILDSLCLKEEGSNLRLQHQLIKKDVGVI